MNARPDLSRPPIPEAVAPVREGAGKFLASFGPLFSFCLVTYGVEIAVLLFLLAPRMSLLARVNFSLFVIVVAAVIAFAYCTLGLVQVGQDGVSATDLWGRRRRLRWDEAVAIRTRRILNLRYLMLHAERGAPLWLPLFLRDRDGFGAAIHRHAPSDHALRAALQLPPR